MVIGVDPHKSTHTAAALNAGTNKTLEKIRIDAAFPEYRRLLVWAKRFPERYWAVENASGLGRHLAQWLIARGEKVTDVPSTATARVRELSRGGRRKNDNIDAAAAASVAALHGDAMPVEAEGASTVLRMLDERRTNLTRQRTRTVNQLHAVMRELLPGGVSTDPTANQATDVLRRLRPSSPVERARKELVRDLISDVRLWIPGSRPTSSACATPSPIPAAAFSTWSASGRWSRPGCWAEPAARHGSAPQERSRSTPAPRR